MILCQRKHDLQLQMQHSAFGADGKGKQVV